MPARKRVKDLYELVMDFLKKCSDDHVGAFGAMSVCVDGYNRVWVGSNGNGLDLYDRKNGN